MGLIGLNDELFSKRALDMREGHGAAEKSHVQAMVVLPQLAVSAGAARTGWRDGNALAHFKVFDVSAKGTDHTRYFMPQCHGLFDSHSAKATVLVVMQIRTANATKGNIHPNLIGAHGGELGGFDSQIFGRVANERAHEMNLELQSLECSGDAAIDIENMAIDEFGGIAGQKDGSAP